MDKPRKCYKNKKLSIKLKKDLTKRRWQVNVSRCNFDQYENSCNDLFSAEPKPSSKKETSLKVSLPKRHYLKAMKQYRNLGKKSMSPNKTEARQVPHMPELIQMKDQPQQPELSYQSELSKRSSLPKQIEPPQQSELPQQHPWGQSRLAQQSQPSQQQVGSQSEPSQKASLSQQLQTSQHTLTPKSGPPQQKSILRPPRLLHVGQQSMLSQQSSPLQQLIKMSQNETGLQAELPMQLVKSQQLRLSQEPMRQQSTLSHQLDPSSPESTSPHPQVGQQSQQSQQSAMSQQSGLPLQSSLPSQQVVKQLRLLTPSGLPQQGHKGLSTMTPSSMSPSSLRMFRHPVPTSKGRIIMSDKFDHIVKTPENLPPNIELKSDPTIPHHTTQSTKADVKITTEESKETNTFHDIVNQETPISIKHKLPFTIMESKGCYRSSNTANKGNYLTSGNNAETTIVRSTQTEEAYIVTKEYYNLLQKMHNSGFSKEELENQLDNMIEQRENHNRNENDTTVIDLENKEVSTNTNQDILAAVLKHSINNKQAIKATIQAMHNFSGQTPQPPAPPAAPPVDHMPASTTETHSAESIPSTAVHTQPSYPSMLPCSEVLKTFMVLATLQKLGFKLQNSMPEPQQSPVHQKVSNAVSTQTTAEDENNNSMGRQQYAANENASELPVLPEGNYQRPTVVQAPQEKPAIAPQQQAFQAQMSPQLPHTQTQQFVPVHVEQPAQFYPSNLRSMMSQQRTPFTETRMPYQYPYEHNRNAAMGNPQMRAQMPTPVQPINRNHRAMQNQLRRPRMSRVLSTDEANLHSQAQRPELNWPYPQYYDPHGYLQRHQ